MNRQRGVVEVLVVAILVVLALGIGAAVVEKVEDETVLTAAAP